VKTGLVAVAPPGAAYIKLPNRHHCLSASSLTVNVSPEDSPPAWRRIGSTLPSCGSSASRSAAGRREFLLQNPRASLRLRPVSESGPTYPHHRSDARSHEVSRPFDATRPHEPPFAGHPIPRHVASFRLPCGSTPCSRAGLPDVFQSGAPMGFGSLQSLTSRKSPPPSGSDIPSCD